MAQLAHEYLFIPSTGSWAWAIDRTRKADPSACSWCRQRPRRGAKASRLPGSFRHPELGIIESPCLVAPLHNHTFDCEQSLEDQGASRTPRHFLPLKRQILRFCACVQAAHYSTLIEGNRLTLDEARSVIADRHAEISSRVRDVSEVRNYWDALLRVEGGRERKSHLLRS